MAHGRKTNAGGGRQGRLSVIQCSNLNTPQSTYTLAWNPEIKSQAGNLKAKLSGGAKLLGKAVIKQVTINTTMVALALKGRLTGLLELCRLVSLV